ncbi:MAG: DNA-binding transcriptional LysR family regulator/ribosomal protein S18 acetylase RimI-like enzyme [Shewanella sp.]|jgi:DNA-binding transcriptional LysR family regulator/ribosomal protein S18 acetylase RimI-like enzyme
MQLNDLTLFVRVADCGSLTGAAVELDISSAVASAGLKRLEKELGTTLFIRSTRSLRLTDAGERYLIHCRRALADLDMGQRAITSSLTQISGTVSLAVPSDVGRNVVLPWLDEFLTQYPELKLRLHIGDNLSDFYRDKIDVALRSGKPKDSSLVAFKICDSKRVLCASPEYIERMGAVNSLEQLQQHNCLFFMLDERTHDQWFFSKEGQQYKVRVTSNRTCNDADIARRWAVAGQGVVFKSWLDLTDDIEAGRLVPMLTDYVGEEADLYLVCPGREHVTPVVLLLRDMLRMRSKTRLARINGRFFKDIPYRQPMKKVRQANSADLDTLKTLAKETIDHCYRSFLGDDGVDWFINGGGSDREVAEQLENIIVLELDGKIRGYCAAEEGFIHILMISPELQRTGLGGYLLAQVEAMQQAEGYEHLRLETFKGNEQALNFYHKHGWSIVGEEQDASFGLVRVFMRKLLD